MKLYAKISGRYVEVEHTSQYIDELEEKNNMLSADYKWLESHCKELKDSLSAALKKIGAIRDIIESNLDT